MGAGQSSIDDLLQNVGTKLGVDPKVMSSLRGVLEADGMAGLVKQFQDQGLGDMISSWIGTGENKAVTKKEISDVFGEKLDHMAAEVGESKDKVSGQLSELLPQLIDKLTPDGKAETEESWMQQGLDALKRYAK